MIDAGPLERIREMQPRAVVLSGRPASVFAEGAPGLDARAALFALVARAEGLLSGFERGEVGGVALAGGPPADWRRLRQLAAETSRKCWAATAACGLRGAYAVSSQAGDAACTRERRLGGYERRRPEQKLLCQLVEQH